MIFQQIRANAGRAAQGRGHPKDSTELARCLHYLGLGVWALLLMSLGDCIVIRCWRRYCLVLSFVCGLPACVIGTWPQPEAQRNAANVDIEPGPSGAADGAAATEGCDDLDNDADGSIDEGCACSQLARGCVGISDGMCGFGVQRCHRGRWTECQELGPPRIAAKTPKLEWVAVVPSSLVRDETPAVVAMVRPVPPCAAIRVPHVQAVIESTPSLGPAMQVKGRDNDKGQGADAVADDGEYTITLPNAFGPGIPAQTLQLRVFAIIDGVLHSSGQAVPLEVPQ